MTTLKLGTLSLFLAIILWGTLLGGIAYAHIVYFQETPWNHYRLLGGLSQSTR